MPLPKLWGKKKIFFPNNFGNAIAEIVGEKFFFFPHFLFSLFYLFIYIYGNAIAEIGGNYLIFSQFRQSHCCFLFLFIYLHLRQCYCRNKGNYFSKFFPNFFLFIYLFIYLHLRQRYCRNRGKLFNFSSISAVPLLRLWERKEKRITAIALP